MRLAALSVAVLMTGLGLVLTPKIKNDGWAWMVPTTGLILVQRYRDDSWAYAEILDRIRVRHGENKSTFPRSKLTDGNWRRLGGTCVQTLGESGDTDTLEMAMYLLGIVEDSGVDAPEGVGQVLAERIEHSQLWAANRLRRTLQDPDFRHWLGDDYTVVRNAVLARLKQATVENETLQLLFTFSHSKKPETVIEDLLAVIPETKSEDSIRLIFEQIIDLLFRATGDGWKKHETAIDHLVSILSCESIYARNEAALLIATPGLFEPQQSLVALRRAVDRGDMVGDDETLGRVILITETLVEAGVYEEMLADELGAALSFLRTLTSIHVELAYFMIRRDLEGRTSGDMDNVLGNLVQDQQSIMTSLKLLSALANDHDPALRALVPAFVTALGNRAPEAIPILADLRLDSSETVRAKAEEAIRQIRGRKAEAP